MGFAPSRDDRELGALTARRLQFADQVAEAEARRDFCGAGDLRASGTGKVFVDKGDTIPLLRNAAIPAAR